MKLTIIDLIHDYMRAAEDGIREMKRSFGATNLLRARRENLLPTQGTAQGKATLKFSFHGVGCAVTTEHYVVDFDFDENGECAGFDAWRLWQFAKSRTGYYGSIESQDAITSSLEDLKKSGRVGKAGKLPNPEMYRLISDP